MSIRSKKDLEIVLSKLHGFDNPSWELEQYITPSDIAAEWIWNMALRGEVVGKSILDAACGPGVLGIGLLLMGADKIFFLDKDKEIIKICMQNYDKIKKEYEIGEAEFIVGDVSLFDDQVDVVVQNPPFGTKVVHADKRFLEKAFESSTIVYSMHKFSTKKFVEVISADFGFTITNMWRYDFKVKAIFKFHQKPVRSVDVGLWRMEKL